MQYKHCVLVLVYCWIEFERHTSFVLSFRWLDCLCCCCQLQQQTVFIQFPLIKLMDKWRTRFFCRQLLAASFCQFGRLILLATYTAQSTRFLFVRLFVECFFELLTLNSRNTCDLCDSQTKKFLVANKQKFEIRIAKVRNSNCKSSKS